MARKLGIEAEGSLRLAARKFHRRFVALEELAQQRGRALSEMPAEEMRRLWKGTKKS